jgi:hypothetical protein
VKQAPNLFLPGIIIIHPTMSAALERRVLAAARAVVAGRGGGTVRIPRALLFQDSISISCVFIGAFFCRYGKDFQRISRRFMPQASLSFLVCHLVSHCNSQHDPKKLEFIYNLRSRRPGTSATLKSAISPNFARDSVFVVNLPLPPRWRRCCARSSRPASSGQVDVVCRDEGP